MQNPTHTVPSTENTYLLEICCDHLLSALAARDGGADRIELCTALSTDGLTPSAGLLDAVRGRLDIPIFVLIRPRPGDFSYTSDELEVMLSDIHHCKALGADGIVSGALRADKRIDLDATARLVAAARPLPFTFHKAFDLTPDPLEALEQLMALGVDRVLTSGQEATALEGREVLAKLVERGAEKIKILCGGGVRHHNLRELRAIPGLKEFHSAAKRESRGYVEVDREMVLMMKEILA